MIVDAGDLQGNIDVWATAFAEEFWDGYGMSGGHVIHCGWGDADPEALALLAQQGVYLAKAIPDAAHEGLVTIMPPHDLSTLNAGPAAQASVESGDETVMVLGPQDPLPTDLAQETLVVLDMRSQDWEALEALVGTCAAADHLRLAGVLLHAPGSAEQATQARWADSFERICRLIAPVTPERLVLVEQGQEYSLEVGPMSCARDLATYLRAICQDMNLPIPAVYYQPVGGMLGSSSVYVNQTHDLVRPISSENHTVERIYFSD